MNKTENSKEDMMKKPLTRYKRICTRCGKAFIGSKFSKICIKCYKVNGQEKIGR